VFRGYSFTVKEVVKPLPDNIGSACLNKCLKLFLLGGFQLALTQQKFHADNLAIPNVNQCLALASAMFAMNMYRLMIARIERDHDSEIFVEFWHGGVSFLRLLVSRVGGLADSRV